MKKQIISIIAAGVLLAASNIHAMAGYNFYFDTPKTEAVPLDQYISSMLPDYMRASPKYRNRFFEAKKIMGIEKPTIFMRDIFNTRTLVGESPIMATQNRSKLPSIITINESSLDGIPASQIDYMLLHECAHVDCNHWGDLNLYAHVVPKLTLPTSALSALYYTTHKYCFGTSKKIALGASLISALGYAYAEKQQNIFLNSEAWSTNDQRIKLCRSYEREADEKSSALLPKFTGRYETIELLLKFHIIAKEAGDQSRPGPLYSTFSDYKSLFTKALKLDESDVKSLEDSATKIVEDFHKKNSSN
jgi:hypothetical protein